MLKSIKLISFSLIFTISALARVELSQELNNQTTVVTSPLIYQRLRFDNDFLQIYRRFQNQLNSDEKKIILRVNVSAFTEDNRTTEEPITFEYYENDKIESTSITQDDLIFEALDRSYQSRLVPAYIYNYDKKEDKLKASDPKLVSWKKCQRDLDFLLAQFEVLERSRLSEPRTDLTMSSQMTPELIGLFDSFSGEEPGLLLGNYHWTANWYECKKRRIFSLDRSNATNTLEFNGRFCLASIRSPKWDKKIDRRAKELEQRKYFKYEDQSKHYARFFRIQLGICVPESCDSYLLERRLSDIQKLAVFKLGEPLRSYKLVDVYCLPDETSELRKLEPSGWAFVYFLIVWCVLVVISSIYDRCMGDQDEKQAKSFMQKFTNSLSIFRNFHRLIETASCQPPETKDNETRENKRTLKTGSPVAKSGKTTNGTAKKLQPNDLLFLNAIKVITMPMIIFGHVGMLFKQLDRFVLDYNGLRSDFVFHFQASTPFFVDWYFVITGFLTTYIMFVSRKVERNSTTQWLYTIFHRYWRLAPMYILLFWFSQSVFMYTSYGPLWDYGTSNMTIRAICRSESWIWPLTLTSNFHPLHEECIMPAWYIACDMQFYMITPLILILLHKSPLMGWLASIGTIGACISLRLHRYLTDERAQPLDLMRPRYDLYMRNNWDMHPTYLYAQYRIATYLIGILAGHYSYMVLSGKWTSIIYAAHPSKEASNRRIDRSKIATGYNLTSILRLGAWLLGAYQLVSMMFATWIISALFPVELEKNVKYFTALVYAFDHTVAGLGMALVLITLMLGQFERVKQFMSNPYWTVLSRVNFIVYLSQVEWIYWLMQSNVRTVELSTLEVVKTFLYLCCTVYAFSTVCALLFEIPFAQLEKNFFMNFTKGPKKSVAFKESAQQQACEMTARVSPTEESSRLVINKRAQNND